MQKEKKKEKTIPEQLVVVFVARSLVSACVLCLVLSLAVLPAACDRK